MSFSGITASATIAAGQTTSGAIQIQSDVSAGVFMDAAMTGTSMTFLAGKTASGTFAPVSDGAGGSYTKTFRAGDYVPIDPSVFAGIPFLKIVSGATEGTLRNLVFCAA